jgi:hypothetical protein
MKSKLLRNISMLALLNSFACPKGTLLDAADASSRYSSYLRLLACPNQRGTRFL